MTYLLENTLKVAALEVFEAVAFMFPITEEEASLYSQSYRKSPQEKGNRSKTVVSINFSGPCSGSLALVVDEGVQKELAANMLGMDESILAPTANQMKDSLRELLNVLCGRVLPRIIGPKAVFDLQPAQILSTPEMPEILAGHLALANTWTTLDTGNIQVGLFIAKSGVLPELMRPMVDGELKPVGTETKHPENILIYHPETMMRASLKSMLDGQNYKFFEAINFLEAIAVNRNHDLNLVLIDATVLQAKANEWFAELGCHSGACNLPVIAIVSSDGGQDSVATLNAGAWDCLEWPCNHALARARLRTALKLSNADLQLRTLSKELAVKNDKLEELNHTAENFVADVSHDFRSPLCVIKEFSSIIGDGLGGPVTKDQLEYLEFINKATTDLSQMVDDLLDTSRLRAGTLRVDRRRCSLESIFEPVQTMLQGSANAKNITLEVDIAADTFEVFADAEKTRRVIMNLCSNAIKYSPVNTHVTLWAKNFSDGVGIGVTDSGNGMSQQELKNIFQRFKRGSTLGKNDARGFGLGLNIASKLVCLCLSELKGESQTGNGSTFSFTLPKYDWQSIVNKYIALLHTNVPSPISVLEVTLKEPEDSIEQVLEFLTSECRPMDVILGDQDSAQLILVGVTEKPDKWIKRLNKTQEMAMAETSLVKYPQILTRVIGTWTCPEECGAVKVSILDHLTGSLNHVH